jgi:hypothetical protein
MRRYIYLHHSAQLHFLLSISPIHPRVVQHYSGRQLVPSCFLCDSSSILLVDKLHTFPLHSSYFNQYLSFLEAYMMEKEEKEVVSVQEVPKIVTEDGSTRSPSFEPGKAEDGIFLVPQPSKDPEDPLVRKTCSGLHRFCCVDMFELC